MRQHGYGERICLINDEAHLPYQRPPLSKAYLKGTGAPDSLMFRPDKFYRDQNIELMADRAVAIDRAARRLMLASGSALDYAHLVLATGARNRLLDIPNANLEDVRYLRTLDESETLRQRIAPGQRVVVIGAGFIGLEFAATARAKGLEVDVVELGDPRHGAGGDRRNLGVFPGAAQRGRHSHPSRRAGDQHRKRRHRGDRRQPQRRPAPARRILSWSASACCPMSNWPLKPACRSPPGSSSTSSLLTADPNISAIGDCALFASPRFGGSLRLESVQNATDHARCVAARLTGDARTMTACPGSGAIRAPTSFRSRA